MPPAVWCAPSNVLTSHLQQLPKPAYPCHPLIWGMALPAMFGPDWSHEREYHKSRQSRLRTNVNRWSQEFSSRASDTTIDTISQSESSTESEYNSFVRSKSIVPMLQEPLVLPESPELSYIGGIFTTQLDLSINTRGWQHKREADEKNDEAINTLITEAGNGQSGLMGPLAFSQSWTNYGSGAGASDAMFSNFSGVPVDNNSKHPDTSFNGFGNSYNHYKYQGRSNDTPQVALSATNTSPQQTPREYPDLFYAQNSTRYASYRGECSRHYKTFQEFMRRGLEKHRNHIQEENITPADLYKAMKVPGPRGEMTEARKEQWYKRARFILFNVHTEQAIQECENAGSHEVGLGQRTRHRNNSNSSALARHAAVHTTALHTLSTTTRPSSTDLLINTMIDMQAGNIPAAVSSLPQQHLSVPAIDGPQSYSSVSQVYDESEAGTLSGESDLSIYRRVNEAVSRMASDLSCINQALYNCNPCRRRSRDMVKLDIMIRHFGQSISQFQSSIFTSYSVVARDPPHQQALHATNLARTPERTSSHPQSMSYSNVATPDHSILTPGMSNSARTSNGHFPINESWTEQQPNDHTFSSL